MTALRVYVASAFTNRPDVRLLHAAMRQFGAAATSSWAEIPGDHVEALSYEVAAEAIAQNDADVSRSHAMLVVAGTGAETFCEARMATLLPMPVLWTGRRALSSYRGGVTYLESEDAALALLRECAVRVELLPDDTRVVRASLLSWLGQRNRPIAPRAVPMMLRGK